MSLSRRQLLFGRIFGEAPDPSEVMEQRTADANDVLARARRRAPWDPVEAPESVAAGQKARIMVFDCLAYMGSTCSSCSEHCPEEGAIVLDAQQRPTVDVSRCTGCGECAVSCPAPRPAIAIGPEAS